MKKLTVLCLVLCLSAALLLSGCGTAIAPDPTPAESYAPLAVAPAEPPSLSEQRALLEQERALWAFDEVWDSPWFYTFTDLDRNGRLEVLAATTQGSGMYTSAHFYEITPDYAGLESCWHRDEALEGPDDWPEIVLDSIGCYSDSAAGRYWYVCENLMRDGFRHQHSGWYALCLENGTATWELLASRDTEFDDSGENPLVICLDAQGNAISEQDYDSAAARRFEGLAYSTLPLNWTRVDAPEPELPSLGRSWMDSPAATSPSIIVTKHPSSESITVGGKNWFIAHAENADSLTWQLVAPDGAVYSLSDAMAAHPGLWLEALTGDTLAVDHVPLSLDGWGVRARFDSADGYAETETANIYVGDFISLYGSVIGNYRSIYANAMTEDAAYLMANDMSELAAYSSGVAYTLKDLDKNGTPELLIYGTGIVTDFAKNVVYDCYTLLGSTPVQLACSQARSRFYLCSDSRLFSVGSGGAAYVYNTLYRLDGCVLLQEEVVFTDQDAAGNLLWYSQQGASEQLPSASSVSISEQTYLECVSAIEGTVYTPPLTSILG